MDIACLLRHIRGWAGEMWQANAVDRVSEVTGHSQGKISASFGGLQPVTTEGLW
jgi:hypothetical protein